MNPLLFCPSPRNIPEVIESWKNIPYDKFIVKNKLERRAYREGREYFLDHPEYTHIVICPDDMIVDYDSFVKMEKIIKQKNLDNLAGLSNIDETQVNLFSCKPLGTDPTQTGCGTYFSKDSLPKDEVFEVGFTGFACQWIERKLVERLSFDGACNNNEGCMDLKFTYEMQTLKRKQYVCNGTFFYHMRMAQYHEVMAWKNRAHTEDEGFSYLMRATNMKHSDKFSYVIAELERTGDYETELRNELKRNIKKNSIVVDAGANIGYHTILMSELAREVHAFEPDRENFENLKENTKDLKNVKLYNKALNEYTGTVKFYPSTICKGMGRIYKAECTTDDFIETECVKLDSMFDHIDLIKMDVEGSEYSVLWGMDRILRKGTIVIFEYNREAIERENNRDAMNIFPYLESLGYSITQIKDDVNNFIAKK